MGWKPWWWTLRTRSTAAAASNLVRISKFTQWEKLCRSYCCPWLPPPAWPCANMTRPISMTPTCNWGQGAANASRPISRSIGRAPQGPMEVKPEGAVAATDPMVPQPGTRARHLPIFWKASLWILLMFLPLQGLLAQLSDNSYQKRVLETAEIDLLFSYYDQDGDHAAVTGGEGSEALTGASSSLVVRMPLGPSDVLTVDAGISAYTSASSSNVNPLDGGAVATPFDASSGESRRDMLTYLSPSYSHSSQDRDRIWSVNAYFSTEYDYYSLGFGGSYSHMFNQGNTELILSGRVFLDKWNARYPIELREGFFDDRIRGNGIYAPIFTPFENETRNSYSLSLTFSQIRDNKLHGAIFVDLIAQEGLLSTPFQRVYFMDFEDFHIDLFQLADDVERLPNGRFKLPLGGRLNYYMSDWAVLRAYYRYYWDDWGIDAHTASLEVPLRITDSFGLYPSYRYYTQGAADHFYPKEEALSTFRYYSSDYDLSAYDAHQ